MRIPPIPELGRFRCDGAYRSSAHAAADVVELERCTHSYALTGDGAPEWVQLTPPGTFSGVDGRGPYHIRDAQAIIAKSLEQAGVLGAIPIDYGHAMEEAGAHGAGAEAAGWITELEAKDDGIWGKVEWTALAAEKIKGRAFRGLSPVFYHDTKNVVQWIARAGLTNKPNLPIKSLNAHQGGEQDSMTDTMKAILARFAALFGLPDTSDEAAIVARCSAAIEAEKGFTAVAHSLKLEPSATADDVTKAVQAQASQAPDPSKYVPIAQYNAVATALEKATQAQIDAAVDAAITAGKITPATKEWAKAYHASDPKGFAAFIEKAPVIVAPGEEDKREIAKGKNTLTADQKAVCTNLGVSEEEFAKNLETTS